MRKRKQEKQIDQQIDQYQILKQKIFACQAKILELEEQIEMKEKRNKFIDDELRLKMRDLNNVEKIFEINKELEINEIKSQNNEQKSNSSTTIYNMQQHQKALNQQQFLYKQKISQEYYSNFMEKYFQYFDSCIGQELIQEKEIENDNEKIYISPMAKFHAIQIQCFVKLLDPELRTKVNQRTADNQDYVTVTFRYSKSDTFDNLKLVCLQYWNIIELDHLYAPDTFNLNQNQYQTKMRKYEFLAPDFTKISNTELVERYCENFEQKFAKEKYVNAILKKKVIKLQGYQEKGEYNAQINESQAASQFVSRTFNNQTLMNYTIQAEDSQLANQYLQNSISGDLSLDDANFAISNMILKMKQSLTKSYYSFTQRFPLLQKMFQIDTFELDLRDQKNIKRKGLKIDDYNILVVLLILILLLLNCIQYSLVPNQAVIQSHINQIESVLKLGKNQEFINISTLDGIFTYFNDLSKFPFYLCNQKSQFNLYYDLIGAVRFRNIKVKEKQCLFSVRSDISSRLKCFYEQQNINTIETRILSQGDKDWMQFKSKNDITISRVTRGKFGEYDQTGYIKDLTKSKQTMQQYRKEITYEMFQNKEYLNINTLALIITFTIKSKLDSSFFFIELLCENTNLGIHPSSPKIKYFRLPNFDKIEDEIKILSYFKLFFSICFLIYMVFVIITFSKEIQSIKSNQTKFKNIFSYFISLIFLMNLIVLYTNFVSISQAFKLLSVEQIPKKMIELEDFEDYGNLAETYQTYFYFLGLSVAALIFRSMLFLGVFESMLNLIESIQFSYLQIMISFKILILILLSFCMIMRSLQGPYSSEFSSFDTAFTSLLQMVMNTYDVQKLLENNQLSTTFFLITFYFLLTYFTFNMIIVVYIDSYRQGN
ncbi:unnamed protein product (macronuclear) [Paramecium tetraurelia]|uniref:Uncharacterized protein n=1 Tax=Paramecium tetraurelia TaxID=5888 RepID=A0D267_PARTE|nr:uncharacterized protein GSPATT00012640001 [Paramecium tetraurelia]CAK77134.1 unnamed protein product [Paramecium tetraurelia]|eukprot:XP_001444531.1 hypothetical protein (macronuclear) [Paramecium tetraurelia strain d4-2]